MKKLVKVIAVITLALQIITFSGCSSSLNRTASGTALYNGFSAAKGPTQYSTADKAAEMVSKSKSANPSKLSAASSRKIVKSANVHLKTSTYDKSVTALEKTVADYGGFVQSSATQGDGNGKAGARTASFTVRVPTARFSDFLDSVGKVGIIVSRSVNGKDISEDYLDTKTRLDTLETEHSRLVKLLGEATKMLDILAIEEKVTSVETSIEEYTGELKKWDSLVDLSTVNISLTETKNSAARTDTFSGTVSYVFSESIGALVTTAKTICYCIVAIVPFAVVLAALCGIVFLILRRRKKHGEQNLSDEQKTGGDDDDKDGSEKK